MEMLEFEKEDVKLELAYSHIKGYNPYVDLVQFMDSEFFEQRFLEYLDNFKEEYVEVLKGELGHQYDYQLDTYFDMIVKKRNDEEVDRILHEHSSLAFSKNSFDNEKMIIELKKRIRVVKNIILAVEPSSMRRLHKIDNKVGEVIDDVSLVLGVSNQQGFSGIQMDELFVLVNPNDASTLEEYTENIVRFKEKIEEICNHYRSNYSVSTATKYIKGLTSSANSFIDDINKINDVSSIDNQMLELLLANGYADWQGVIVHKYISKKDDVPLFEFDRWVLEFRKKIDEFKIDLEKRYSANTIDGVFDMVDTKTGQLIDKIADSVGYSKEYESRIKDIFDSYQPLFLDVFDRQLYSSDEECDLAYRKYYPIRFDKESCLSILENDSIFKGDLAVSFEELEAFEMRMYEQYIRIFKGKIRELNKSVRQTYSLKRANKMISSINKRADALIRSRAVEIGRPVPKNPWIVRKYLWTDTTNFVTEGGIKFRQFINPLMRQIVKLKMENRVIIEERPQLDPTKSYVFVPTHYFTEDIIGLFSSLGRQGYMLLGTTDQIENNPLMIAAVLFGFFHVDRMDTINRHECLEKQNQLIEYGTNVINYISGSWENSENELQPPSFSGPYRTSVAKEVQIVPVASYLVRESNTMYVRYGEPLDLSKYDENTANDVVRDTLATMHFKQLHKHSIPIETIEIDGYGVTHNLPYNQHTYYMEQVANEYWKQYWSKPFAVEEIGLRDRKITTEEDVYRFVDDLSRDKLMELSSILAEPLLRRYEKDIRYNVIKYIDENYARLRNARTKRKVKKES